MANRRSFLDTATSESSLLQLKRMSRQWGVLMLAALLLSACAGEASTTEEGTNNGAASHLAEQLLPLTSDSQRPMLEDFQVSRQEYELAHEYFFDCMMERGWDGAPEPSLNGITYDLAFFNTGRDAVGFDDDMASCEQEYLDDVVAVYGASLVSVSVESADVAKDELMACLEGAGVSSASRDWSDGELAEYLEEVNATDAAWVCREVALVKLGPDR